MKKLNNMSRLVAILPRNNTAEVVEAVFTETNSHAMIFPARGTLVRERWYQKFLPVISPEQEHMVMLLPNDKLEEVIYRIIEVSKLRKNGAGAIMATPCTHFSCGDGYALWPSDLADDAPQEPATEEANLWAINYIAQPEQSDQICKAAIDAGAHGPSINFCEGKGQRSQISLLRVTSEKTKEAMTVIADSIDVDGIYESMAEAAQPTLPGRGIMYKEPVSKGLVNLPGIFHHAKNAASMQQIVRAIDSLTGSKEWRDQSVVDFSLDGKSAGLNMIRRLEHQLTDDEESRSSFHIAIDRNQEDKLKDFLLKEVGIQGMTVTQSMYVGQEYMNHSGLTHNHQERSIIKTIVKDSDVTSIRDSVDAYATDHSIDDICYFSVPVKHVLTWDSQKK